jgi:hypothetical protein
MAPSSQLGANPMLFANLRTANFPPTRAGKKEKRKKLTTTTTTTSQKTYQFHESILSEVLSSLIMP